MKDFKIFACLYVFAIIVFLAHFIYVGRALFGDALYYYSYLPALIAGHTFNLANSFTHLGITQPLSPTGLVENIYPIGPSIFWAIPFIITNIITTLIGIHNPFSLYYQIIIGIWDVSLLFLGLYFLFLSLKHFFTEKISLITIFIIFLTTNLFFYGAVDVINSHSISFFLSSLFLYLWLGKQSIKTAILLGILVGCLAMVRSQDAIFIIFPFISLLKQRMKYLIQFLIICLAAFITFLPQVFVWHIIWGTWFVNPYLYRETFSFLHPQIMSVLLSKHNGLFLWTPILAFSLIGLIIFTYRKITIGIPLFIFFILQVYIIASWAIWWQGASYSGRMFISSIPSLSFGVATLLSIKSVFKLRYLLTFLFTGLNFMLIILFLLST